jgi:hypothetical protein
MGQRSSREPRTAVNAVATSEPSRDVAMGTGSWQREAAVATSQVLVPRPFPMARAGSSGEPARGGP